MKKLCLVGFRFSGGQCKYGVANAFPVIASDFCKDNPIEIISLQPSPDSKKSIDFACSMLSCVVTKLLVDNYYPIVIGGDHSMAIGSIHGAKQYCYDMQVCWIDAHLDANTEKTSPSGNVHGMPVAVLAGKTRLHNQFTCIDIQKDIQYVGVRDCDPGELELVRRNRVPIYPHLDQYTYIDKYTEHRRDRPAWVSLDVDALDSEYIQATGTPVSGGLTPLYLRKTLQVSLPGSIGMDIAEINFELLANGYLESQMELVRCILKTAAECVSEPQK